MRKRTITLQVLLSFVLALGGLAPRVADLCAAEPARLAEILEDDAEGLLKVLTNPTGDPGQGFVEGAHVFSGKQAIRIVPMQRFNNIIPGWAFVIREQPKLGEYRYLRFAWKTDGGTGIMLQLHDEKGWRIRYTAGRDMYSWGTKFVADQPPKQWTVVTCDLFADFGEQTLSGIALTNFDAPSAYFDHIYLARTIDELDRIDATGFRATSLPALTEAELETLWTQLASNDAQQVYHAHWRLVAAQDQAIELLREKLTNASDIAGPERIRSWLKALDDDRYSVRERAMRQLAIFSAEARPALEHALTSKPSAEVEWRVKLLLAEKSDDQQAIRLRENAKRVLVYIDSSDAQQLLKRFF